MYTLWRPGVPSIAFVDQLPHGVDAVVRGRVQLVDVVAGAGLDGEARGALAARLAVDRALAVEHLGEDAGGRRLARAPRAAEEVGVADAVVPDGVAQCSDHVVLAAQLAEPAGPVAAVERLVGHRGEPTGRVSQGFPAPRVAVQARPRPPTEVVTRRSAAHEKLPLKAAASRP